ncbi:pyruvate ferredoxin oxidoreductase [Hoylesella shahii]|mgnify:FL=1|jgi:putative pyruvate synthase|uniref:pyruvate ferredoxin oxidoreductase n=1 Tax=Hoylesella shahii TaxID=228603 RepID=UPI0028E59355|nr:pyruvate ferredoxin oxidoreductase [Hoylesella shahii]
MDYKYINQLLERYWNCETSLEEEGILRAFFSQKDVPAELRQYQPLFAYQQLEAKEKHLGADFDNRLLAIIEEDEPIKVKARTITLTQRLKPLFKAAAVVAIFLTLGNAAQESFQTQQPSTTGVAGYNKVEKGASVALRDSAAIDTIKPVGAPAASLNIIK